MTRSEQGFSLLEMVVVSTVFLIVSAAIAMTLKTGQESSQANLMRSEAVEQAKKVVTEIARDLEESSLWTVDPLFRYAYTGYNYSYNHAYQSGGWKQCTSSTCPWANKPDGTAKLPQAHLTQYRYTYGSTSYLYKYGRMFPPSETRCPHDGSYLMTGGYVSGLKFFSPRDSSNAFVTNQYSALEKSQGMQGKADWQSIVFYMPFYNSPTGKQELRRYVIYMSDLLNAASAYSSNWTAWANNSPANTPMLLDLVDFSKDGTTDGVPDGSMPITTAKNDAQYEYWYTYSWSSGGYLYWYKYLYDGSKYRYFYIYIDLATGYTYWYVYFADNSWANYWYRYAYFTRAPKILTRHLVGADFATKTSNPYDATANPAGVSSSDVVRVTLGVEREAIRNGAREFTESVQTVNVAPRNF